MKFDPNIRNGLSISFLGEIYILKEQFAYV
jgi:hypothetical protein